MNPARSLQAAAPEDPWLQGEWGEVMGAVGRTQEAVMHLSVSALLLRRALEGLKSGGGGGMGQDGE